MKTKMIRLILFTLLMCVFTGAMAQDHITVKGSVIDKRSRDRIPYANIFVKGKSIGTVSNSTGEFEFHIPSEFAADSMYVSHIGYKTLKFNVGWLSKNRMDQFALEEDAVLLGEIVVSSDMAKVKVEQALKAIQNNYPTQPYLMDAFYRSWEIVDFTDSISYPGTIIESALVVYDPGYKDSKKTTEKTYVREVRRSKLMPGWNYNKGNLVGEKLFRGNQVKYNKFKAESFLSNFLEFPSNLEFSVEDIVKYDGEDVAIITAQVPNSRNFPAEYKIYISQEDNAILRFTLTGTSDDSNKKTPYSFTDLEHIYIYKRYEGRCYLSYAKIKYQVKKVNLETGKVLQKETYFNELLVSDVIINNVAELHKNYMKNLSKKSPVLETGKYNTEFWSKYNIVSENPIDKAILQAFEKNVPLEKQYEDAEAEYKKLKRKVPKSNR